MEACASFLLERLALCPCALHHILVHVVFELLFRKGLLEDNQEVMRFSKEVVLAGADSSLDAGLTLERKAFDILFDTENQKEGMRAFIEKRKPVFKGK